MKKLKILTVVGTRPEIIRLSRVLARLDEHCEHVLSITGQALTHLTCYMQSGLPVLATDMPMHAATRESVICCTY